MERSRVLCAFASVVLCVGATGCDSTKADTNAGSYVLVMGKTVTDRDNQTITFGAVTITRNDPGAPPLKNLKLVFGIDTDGDGEIDAGPGGANGDGLVSGEEITELNLPIVGNSLTAELPAVSTAHLDRWQAVLTVEVNDGGVCRPVISRRIGRNS